MTTTATLRDTFLDLTDPQVSVLAGMLAFARMLDEAKAVA